MIFFLNNSTCKNGLHLCGAAFFISFAAMFETIKIDPGAGPCFGVERAIQVAEKALDQEPTLYSMGDIVHNEEEMLRLERMGMETISFDQALQKKPQKVLFRAHGEPPASYKKMQEEGIEVKDATCPIVLRLQKDIAKVYEATKGNNSQILIFGKRNHPEVVSLLGHCADTAVLIEHSSDLERIDFDKTLYLFSQTTKYKSDYMVLRNNIIAALEQRGKDPDTSFIFHKSSCRIVANRDTQLRDFVQDRDLMIFVSGAKSSNGKQLFNICKQVQPNSYFVSRPEDIELDWFQGYKHIGVSGATSTPLWLLEKVKAHIENICKEQ